MKKVLVITSLNYSLGIATCGFNDIVSTHTKACVREVVAKQYKVDVENVSVYVFDRNAGLETQIKQLNTLNHLTAEKFDEVLIIGCNREQFHFAMVKIVEINPEVKISASEIVGGIIRPCIPTFMMQGRDTMNQMQPCHTVVQPISCGCEGF